MRRRRENTRRNRDENGKRRRRKGKRKGKMMTMMMTMKTMIPPTTPHKTKVMLAARIQSGFPRKVLSRERTGKVIGKV